MDEKNIFKKLNRLKIFCDLPKTASWNNYKVLKTALQCEQKDVALFLLSTGCRVNRKSDVIDNTPLHYAVGLEDTELIQTLISKGASLTCQNQKGDTPLHIAAMSRNTEIVDLLLLHIDSTQYVNPANNFGLTHMHIACMRNKPDIVKRFLKNGVGENISINPDSPFWPGYTPMHFAVEFSCIEVVQLLMKGTTDIEYKDAEGISPLDLAYVKYQNASMIDYFTGYDEEPIILNDSFESKSDIRSNFLVACLEGNTDIMKKYLKYGADINIKAYSFCVFKGDTPLHCAIRSESVDAVNFLIANNADITSANDYGMTPLHAAFYQVQSDFDYIILNDVYSAYNFIKEGNVLDKNGLSYFHIICGKGDTKLIKYFLKMGVEINSQIDINAKYFAGCTALYFAIRNYERKAVKLLLQCGADIGIIVDKDIDFKNPFEFMLSNRWAGVLEIISQKQFNLNTIKDENGGSAFHILINYISCFTEDNEDSKIIRIIKILHNYGCNINNQANNGCTPLHVAFCHQAHVYIQTLLDLGADINIENNIGETPIMIYRKIELSMSSDFPIIAFPVEYKIYLSHVEKLKIIGFYVSKRNRLFIKQLFEEQAVIDPDKICLDSEYYYDLKQLFKNEIKKMKHIKVANYSSLYDILFADANGMAFHCNNQTFLDIMELDDFDNQFPSYGYLLKLQFKKGKERKAVLAPAMDALKFIFVRELPAFCSEKVLSYLSDKDLKNLMQITTSYIDTN